MKIEVRRAARSDLPAIARVLEEAFAEPPNPRADAVDAALSHDCCFVALGAGDIKGFVHNFVTLSQSGSARLELDLLAVAVDARGRGIGARLVACSLACARRLDLELIRALVARDNDPMRRLCRAAGLQPSPHAHSLYSRAPVAERETGSGPHDAHLIEAHTLIYSGIWLEGALCTNAIAAADALAHERGLTLIGAVIGSDDVATARLLAENDFRRRGEFDWWTLNPRSARF